MTDHFGEHWMLDGYGCEPALLKNSKIVFNCLVELPELLHMKKIAPPSIFEVYGNAQKDLGGFSGVALIQESHISIHTFPCASFLSVDVYTCQNGLDNKFLENYFKKIFLIKETEINFIIRGTKYKPLAT